MVLYDQACTTLFTQQRVLLTQDPSRKRTPGGPLSWVSSLFATGLSFLALAMLFALGSQAIRRYSGAGAGALAGGPATSITGAGGASYAPKEYNKVKLPCTAYSSPHLGAWCEVGVNVSRSPLHIADVCIMVCNSAVRAKGLKELCKKQSCLV